MEKVICKICGMEINVRNYDLNREGLINKNSSEEINSCPFCGAGNEYIAHNNLINYGDTLLDYNTIKILDNAMKLEVFNGDFYRKASFLAEEEKNRKLFEALSKIEMIHARVHQKLGGFKELPVLKEMDYSKYKGDEILLEMASKREVHAVEYYSRYTDIVCSEHIKEVFRALSKVEREHIELTLYEIKNKSI